MELVSCNSWIGFSRLTLRSLGAVWGLILQLLESFDGFQVWIFSPSSLLLVGLYSIVLQVMMEELALMLCFSPNSFSSNEEFWSAQPWFPVPFALVLTSENGQSGRWC